MRTNVRHTITVVRELKAREKNSIIELKMKLKI